MRFVTALALALAGVALAPPRKPIGKFTEPAIREASGIVKSRRHPGVYWTHNDSGNPPALFAVKGDGTLIRAYRIQAPNVDWEDIAADDHGHLFLGDIGNNDKRLPLRAIYRIDEPDPAKPAEKPLPFTLVTFYRFANGQRFDAEGFYLEKKRAILVAKQFERRDAELFAVPLDPPAPLFRPAVPERVGTLPGFIEPATGASLAPDGQMLAVCSTEVVRVYERSKDLAWTLIGTVRYKAEEIEAVCWDGKDLILASEARDIYRITERTWRRSER
jgi:hypothetical protein